MKAYLEIEMPETCCACPLFNVNMSKQNFCKAFGAFDRSDYDKLPFERLKNCPLVPVPPHGRLIDADAAVANRNADMNWCYDLYDLPDYLSGCPTIIPPDPAEEGE